MTTAQTIDLRAAKGFIIANTKYQIKKITEHAFIVKSQSSKKEYVVSNVLGDWNCECPDHSYRHVRCKHMFAVKESLENHKEKPLKQRRARKLLSASTISI